MEAPAQTEEKTTGWRGSRELWLDAACDALLEGGVDAVKIQPLAARLALSRTSFYWFFRDRTELLDALLERWDARNTASLVAGCEAYAETLTEAVDAPRIHAQWMPDVIFHEADALSAAAR